MSNKIKLVIVDDSKLTLMGLKTTFSQVNDITLISTFENGQLAVDNIPSLKPDVVLMDIGMPILDGIEATKQLKKFDKSFKIIMLTSHDNEEDVLDALKAGADSYCMKEIEPEDLINVVKTTYNGSSWLDPNIARIVLNDIRHPSGKKKNTVLTEREIEVLALIAKGHSNQQISDSLYISMNTVKTHIKNIFSKLEVDDRTKAAMKAVENKLI